MCVNTPSMVFLHLFHPSFGTMRPSFLWHMTLLPHGLRPHQEIPRAPWLSPPCAAWSHTQSWQWCLTPTSAVSPKSLLTWEYFGASAHFLKLEAPVQVLLVTSHMIWMQSTMSAASNYSGWWFQPLWKIWKSIGMMKFPIYGKIKNGNQTTSQYLFDSSCFRLQTQHVCCSSHPKFGGFRLKTAPRSKKLISQDQGLLSTISEVHLNLPVSWKRIAHHPLDVPNPMFSIMVPSQITHCSCSFKIALLSCSDYAELCVYIYIHLNHVNIQ